jgi:hypothetical protein
MMLLQESDREQESATDASTRHRWRAALAVTAWGRTHVGRVLLVEDGARLASATRYTLTAFLDRRPVRVCGIGDVVAPDTTVSDDLARHALVERLLSEATAAGAEVALLFSPLDPDWCRDRQFEDITPETLTLSLRATRRPGAPMMIRAGEDRDLPAIAAIGYIHAEPYRFHLERDVDYIQYGIISKRLLAGLSAPGSHQLQFFVAEEGSTAVAYVVLSVTGGTWRIEACGDRDPLGQRLGSLLQALVARDPSNRPVAIQGWLPATLVPPQVDVIARELSPPAVMASLIGSQRGNRPLQRADALFWGTDVF